MEENKAWVIMFWHQCSIPFFYSGKLKRYNGHAIDLPEEVLEFKQAKKFNSEIEAVIERDAFRMDGDNYWEVRLFSQEEYDNFYKK